MENKVTKKDILIALESIIPEEIEIEVGEVIVSSDDMKAYILTTIDQLDAKAKKAKEKAKEKKAEGDALRDQIEALITNEFKTGDEIVNELNDPTITKSKVVARLGQLIKLEKVEKELRSVDGGRKIVFYRLPQNTVEAEKETEEEV